MPLAFLGEYVLWVKVSFMCWITFYLFSLTVCNCNPSQKCQEMVYVVTSVLLPLPFACVPFITQSYGLAKAWCWIKATDDNCATLEAGVIEQFALAFVPLLIITLSHSSRILTDWLELGAGLRPLMLTVENRKLVL